MSQSPRISPWWALLLIPAGVFAGWFAGQLSGSTPGPAQPSDAQVSMTTESPDAGSAVPGDASSEAWPPPPEPAEPQGPVISSWTTLQDAVGESQRNGKPVLIDFNAEWCGPCRMMKQEVFDDWTRGQAVRTAVIPVSIVDRLREDGRNPSETDNLQERFEVRAFPTLVVFSPATGRAVRTEGYMGADATVAWITEAVKSVR